MNAIDSGELTHRADAAVPDRGRTVLPAAESPTRHQPVRSWLRGHVLLLAIMLGGLVARGWEVMAQLPVVYHSDEPTNIRVMERMVSSGSLDPHFFNYPSLFFYLQDLVSPDGPVLRWLLPGRHDVPLETLTMGTSYAPATLTVLTHRALTVVFGVLLIAVVWSITRRSFGGTLAPAVAAGLTALSPNLIEHSEYATPDMLAALLIALAVLAAVQLLQTGSMRAHVVAGACVGLAVSAKYNAALVGAAVVVAGLAWFRRSHRGAANILGRLLVSGAAAALAFALTTPYALIDRTAFLAAVEYERLHYATGHPGMQGNTPAFYLSLLFGEEWPITVLACVGIVAAFAAVGRGRWLAGTLIAFPLVYCPFVFSMAVRNDRTILVILPVLAPFAGYAVRWFGDEVLARLPRGARTPTGAAVAAILVVGIAIGVPTAVTPTFDNEAQVAASRWVTAHVRPGATIVLERYSPWLDPAVYRITAERTLIGHPLPAGTQYVIASRTMYGRYTENPDQFPTEAAAYRSLFRSLRELRVFTVRDNTIRIFQVRDH